MKFSIPTFKRWFKFASRLLRRFNADGAMNLAGALSFYFLMSIFPLTLLGLSILGFILGNQRDAVGLVTSLGRIGQIMPEGSIEIREVLNSLISGKSFIGGVGLLLLAWFATGVFFTVEVSVNKIFRTGKKRGFFKRTGVVYLFMLVAGGLLVASIALTVVQAMIADLSVSLFGIDPKDIPFLWNLLVSLFIPALMMMMFTIIYKVGPNIDVRWKTAFAGGFFAAILWEISRRLFGWYLSNLAVYNKLYGALGAIVALLIWLFYSMNIFLLGAEFAAIKKEQQDRKNIKEENIRTEAKQNADV